MTDDPQTHVTIDVEALTVEVPNVGWRRAFALDDLTRARLLNGWDDVGLTMRHADEITPVRGDPLVTLARRVASTPPVT